MRRKKDAVYKRGDVSDESEGEETKDGGFILDPEQIFDELPQPYRLIDKTLNYIFDKTWETIEELEIRRNEFGLGGKIPLFDCAKKVSDVFQPTLMCSSEDGQYIFIVAKNGMIYAVDGDTASLVASNEELQGLNTLFVSSCCLEASKHFVCTLMDNGSAAIFVLSNECLHLVRVFSEESSVKNSVAMYIQISFDGNYIAVGWKIPLKSSWVDIYKVPKEFWVNQINIADKKAKKQLDQELLTKDEETSKPPENDSSDSENECVNSRPTSPAQDGTNTGFVSETSFSKPTLLLKIRSPMEPTPNQAGNASSALKVIDPDSNIIGTGTNHVLLQQYFDHSYAIFKDHHEQYLEYLPDKEEDSSNRIPTLHFLTPGRFIPAGFENAPDQVNSIVIHWSEDCHGFMFSLVRTTKDVERKPDFVLTNSSGILVSDVSVCKTIIAFGLENNNIVTWDKLRGVPLYVINLPTSGGITSLHFLPSIKPAVDKDKSSRKSSLASTKLLVCSANGGLDMLQNGRDGQTTVTNVPSSSFKIKDPVVQVVHLPNLPKLVVVQRSSGNITILDMCTNTPKCHIGLIKPLIMLEGFCYAHGTSLLYIKGGQNDEYEEEIVPDSVSVFTMNIETFPVLKCYHEEIVQSQTSVQKTDFDKHIEEMEKERIRTQEKRQRHRSTRWRQFEAELKRTKKTQTLGGSTWLSSTVET